MPVRRTLSTALFRSIEPRLEEWMASHPADRTEARLAALEEQNAKLEKKLSMAMGAIQAATAQIVSLRQEVEQATNLAHQAMQRATTAATTAEAATAGVAALEGGPAATPAPSKPAPERKPRAKRSP